MQVIIENTYTKKLYNQLKVKMTQLQLITMADIDTLDSCYECIVDEDDFEAFETLRYKSSAVIVLTEKKMNDLPLRDNVRYVKKYQSTRNILTLISQLSFPMTFLGFATKSLDKESIIETVKKKYDIDRIISLDFSPISTFSLFDSLTRFEDKVLNQANLDVITNIEDYLNPPIPDLIIFLNQLKKTNRLLIVSSPLKGKLDASLMDLSDTIILVENDKTMKLETHLSYRLESKHFEVITYD